MAVVLSQMRLSDTGTTVEATRTPVNRYIHLVDCPTQLIRTWVFILCSMTKLKEQGREIC